MAHTEEQNKQYRCFCIKCGGPNGPGKATSKSTFYRHLPRKQLYASGIEPLLVSPNIPTQSTSTPAPARQPSAGPSSTRPRSESNEEDSGAFRRIRRREDSIVEGLEDMLPQGEELYEYEPVPELEAENHYVQQPEPPSPHNSSPPNSPPNFQEDIDNPPDDFDAPGSNNDNNDDDDQDEQPIIFDPEFFEAAAGRDPELAAEGMEAEPILEDLRIANAFIRGLRDATLESTIEPIDDDLLDRLRNPPQEILSVNDPDEKASIEVYLGLSTASEQSYEDVRRAMMRRFPEFQMLSYFKVKALIAQLTGVSALYRDMCPKSCCAFTGPYVDLQQCPFCNEDRYEPQLENSTKPRKPRHQFQTIPIGPQLQALWRSQESAEAMRYRQQYTQSVLDDLEKNNGQKSPNSPYRDFFDGSGYLDAHQSGLIAEEDMLLVLSMDGAQLYRDKASECWIYIWIILDIAPDARYKKRHVLPGGIIPGPGKPKNLDSFLFPGLHHVSALQKEKLRIWDAISRHIFLSSPLVPLVSADGPAMALLAGYVGHTGRLHCRFYCPIEGRRKINVGIYYPARFKPDNYTVIGSSHPDQPLEPLLRGFTPKSCVDRYRSNLALLTAAVNLPSYRRIRLQTGLVKPTIFSGLPKQILPVPTCFAGDIMHLPALNIPDLFIKLWRGEMTCEAGDSKESWPWLVLTGETWKQHGQCVVDIGRYIPGSFDRPPRNPALKINSGYKAWEFSLYFFGMGPCLFFGILPPLYWKNYCKLVRGFRILMQESILTAEVLEANQLLSEFSDEFEKIYCNRKSSRLHFVRPAIHALSHFPWETIRLGAAIIYSQWAIERTIGNLGEEIRLHSNPFYNLMQRALRRCQTNALKAMIPDLENPGMKSPRVSVDIGGSYTMLGERAVFTLPAADQQVLRDFVAFHWKKRLPDGNTKITRYARLRLPNGQIARSLWKEAKHVSVSRGLRISRNIKLRTRGQAEIPRFAEIHYFFILNGVSLALASFYGNRDEHLFIESSQTYWTVQHTHRMEIIEVKNIQSVVTMAPDPRYRFYREDGSEQDRFFLMEKPGLQLAALAGYAEEDEELR